jgi:dCMP deaminase
LDEVNIHIFESNKYPFMSHAESNAIFYGDKTKLVGSTIYVTGFPCENCALQIARAKIARVVVTDTINDANSNSKQVTRSENCGSPQIILRELASPIWG